MFITELRHHRLNLPDASEDKWRPNATASWTLCPSTLALAWPGESEPCAIQLSAMSCAVGPNGPGSNRKRSVRGSCSPSVQKTLATNNVDRPTSSSPATTVRLLPDLAIAAPQRQDIVARPATTALTVATSLLPLKPHTWTQRNFARPKGCVLYQWSLSQLERGSRRRVTERSGPD